MNARNLRLVKAAGGVQQSNSPTSMDKPHKAKSSDRRLPPGKNYCLCRACDRYFGGAEGFSDHRQSFKCVNPSKLGMMQNIQGYWVRPGPKRRGTKPGGEINTLPATEGQACLNTAAKRKASGGAL
jgi:hypothetical protein